MSKDTHQDHAAAEKTDVFGEIMGSLGDHRELDIGFMHFDILPVILIDEGLHFYPNNAAMEAAGQYTLHHPEAPHKLVSTTKADTDGNPMKPSLDLSITNFVAYELIGATILTIMFMMFARKYRRDPLKAPGGLRNAVEAIVVYVRDDIVRPNVGTDKRTERLMPYMLALFFFILCLNLIGLVPGGHAATSALGLTCGLALTSFAVVNWIAIRDAGVGSWFHHLLGGAPVYLAPIMVPIEIVGLFTKPFALMIRLFANMTAGHIVVLSLIGLIFIFKSWAAVPISIGFTLFIYAIELLVAFLQAYIFTMLTAVFVGLALGDHAPHDRHSPGQAHP